ncbi:hypothetical protein INT45_007682 [Circinella minor]|uniref:Uncharacterized protein n=1 Tax=Circinella minor TaxID=1195481 RepID=A0A8H7VB39_9FUNG|nr:hypothetical protein INT45_007682 [Circinella minor]
MLIVHFLIYCNICGVSENLFSHPLFNDVTQLQPSIVTPSPDGCVILGLMLAPDQTVSTGDMRKKAWPVYISLSNTPIEYRRRDTLHRTRLLAYLPVIESKSLANKKWFLQAKQAIYHYCIDHILTPFKTQQYYLMKGPDNMMYKCVPALASYSVDLSEQRLLALMHYFKGIYTHLLDCVEMLIINNPNFNGTTVITEINTRASNNLVYKEHRPFNKGIFSHYLKNPTYTEMRSNMVIILPYCYDYFPLQACLCLRQFLDFIMNAITEYYKHLPIFQKYSPSSLNFPKNHILQKYVNDIRERGIISGYSTTSSEHQHSMDVKKSSKRTNQKFNSLEQMANFAKYLYGPGFKS